MGNPGQLRLESARSGRAIPERSQDPPANPRPPKPEWPLLAVRASAAEARLWKIEIRLPVVVRTQEPARVFNKTGTKTRP
jgi:hypothetical protein